MGVMGISTETSSFNAIPGNTYLVMATCTATLPSSSAVFPAVNGAEIIFIVDGAYNLTIQAAAGQTIQMATSISSTAGTQTNTMSGDTCSLIYSATDSNWIARSFVGAWSKT